MIRTLTADDLPQIVLIEQQVQLFPWSQLQFEDALAAGYWAYVIEFKKEIKAYALMMFGVDDAEILTIAVVQSVQRQGLGRQLLVYMVERAQQLGMQRLLLEVAEPNQAALRLYLSQDFSEIGRRKNYYQCQQQKMDALVLARKLS